MTRKNPGTSGKPRFSASRSGATDTHAQGKSRSKTCAIDAAGKGLWPQKPADLSDTPRNDAPKQRLSQEKSRSKT
jgi:hypothetical protein